MSDLELESGDRSPDRPRWSTAYRTETERIKQAHPSLIKVQAVRWVLNRVFSQFADPFLPDTGDGETLASL